MKLLLLLAGMMTANAFADPMNQKEKLPSSKQCCTFSKLQECQGGGEPLKCCQGGYNAPASIDVTQSDIAFFLDGSFTYWYAGQDGMAVSETGIFAGGTVYYPQNIDTFFQTFDYKPGFKIGGGATFAHEWSLFFEYTWFRGTNHSSSSVASGTAPTAGTSAALLGTNVWVVNDWFLQGTDASQALSGTQVRSSWKLSMDLVDFLASRPFYQARKLVVSPVAGLQLAFIRQWMDVSLTELPALFSGAIPVQPIASKNHSSSWAIGPKMGVGAEYLSSYGIRFEGNFSASLLYTSYDVNHSEDAASTGFNAGPYTASYSDYTTIRPLLESGLGLGWGTYFCNQNYHIDFSADYDFKLLWSQNMMRKLLDDSLTGTSPSSSDLYLHGLTLKARFDF